LADRLFESLELEEARLSTGCSEKMIKRTRGRKFNYFSRMKVFAIGQEVEINWMYCGVNVIKT